MVQKSSEFTYCQQKRLKGPNAVVSLTLRKRTIFSINPNPHCLGIVKSLFCKHENKSWMFEAKYFLKIKNVCQKI
jgi:hypothetical protein